MQVASFVDPSFCALGGVLRHRCRQHGGGQEIARGQEVGAASRLARPALREKAPRSRAPGARAGTSPRATGAGSPRGRRAVPTGSARAARRSRKARLSLAASDPPDPAAPPSRLAAQGIAEPQARRSLLLPRAGSTPHLTGMPLDLSDEEDAALTQELHDTVESDRYLLPLTLPMSGKVEGSNCQPGCRRLVD
jgi:hypothetical protein